MHVYIWKDADCITHRWHNSGGLLIVAPSIERARELWLANPPYNPYGDLPDTEPPLGSTATDPDPDIVLPTSSADELVVVFPDSGCC